MGETFPDNTSTDSLCFYNVYGEQSPSSTFRLCRPRWSTRTFPSSTWHSPIHHKIRRSLAQNRPAMAESEKGEHHHLQRWARAGNAIRMTPLLPRTQRHPDPEHPRPLTTSPLARRTSSMQTLQATTSVRSPRNTLHRSLRQRKEKWWWGSCTSVAPRAS